MLEFKKKLKLLLSKEDARISKLALVPSVVTIFSLNDIIAGYNLDKELFNITGNNVVQHQHNVIIRINNTEPNDITFNEDLKQSCLIITAIGGSACCGNNHFYWSDITGEYDSTPSNDYKCQGNEISKKCSVRGNYMDYGFVLYEWHNNDPNFDCSSQYGTFYTNVKEDGIKRVNTWKNVI